MLLDKAELTYRRKRLYKLLESCTLCPHRCGVNRIKGEKGYCKVASQPVVASYGPHFGEEGPLVGEYGSGTIFFSGCNMRCIYCQNYDISHLIHGEPVSPEMLAFFMLSLKEMGCHNINLVTPTHVIPFWVRAIELIEYETGFQCPIVYNCGGYESLETLELLDGIVDIYMPDLKYYNPDIAFDFSKIKDYPAVSKRAVKEMYRQVGGLVCDEMGIAKRGLIIRHLVLPEGIGGTQDVLRFISGISSDIFVNVMGQYRPCGNDLLPEPLKRGITKKEYMEALRWAKELGLGANCVGM